MLLAAEELGSIAMLHSHTASCGDRFIDQDTLRTITHSEELGPVAVTQAGYVFVRKNGIWTPSGRFAAAEATVARALGPVLMIGGTAGGLEQFYVDQSYDSSLDQCHAIIGGPEDITAMTTLSSGGIAVLLGPRFGGEDKFHAARIRLGSGRAGIIAKPACFDEPLP
jgi:hypothetical protein